MSAGAVTETDLSLALRLARAAGAILDDHWRARDRLTPQDKRAGDFVSEADMDAERHLRAGFAAARPDDGWLGEETGEGAPARRRWIVDPLDGTTNFLRGIPHWAVSVALEEDGKLVLGVVHDPLRGETFAARAEGPATLNGTSIAPAATATLTPALFATGIPFGDMPHIDAHARDIARLVPQCAGVRRMGAAALDLAWVAAGRYDGFWERRLRPWDIAGGLVIMRAAGVRVAALDPAERPEDRGTVLAAAPGVFDAFAALLRDG
ncbi:inositol monophosphatase family protein [Roseivivax isoporae]|uniref:Inositol-1-monophosphatase n=1 Tax=Roseivivax isoporae LMG 25204 TaxID=1449351 RepID=X7F802_9RHOB|nr:inositol monophosphatase family protein [Roseivivax isoporae]ETX28930.1 hypothetical protein RISW2_04245 [Roseivivax isoporae LMG 25204]